MATITTFSSCSQLPASSFVEMNCDQEKIFFSVSTAFCLPRLEPGSLVCFEYPLQSGRFSLKMIHVKEMLQQQKQTTTKDKKTLNHE